jgi:transposase-like protein
MSPDKIKKAIDAAEGNVTQAARALDVSRSALWYHAKKLGKLQSQGGGEEDETRELRALEAKLRRANEKLKTESKKREQAEVELEQAENTIQTFASTKDEVQTYDIVRRSKTKNSKATAIICANDWHLEKCIAKEEVNGVNEFNLNIAKRRIDRLWQKSVHMLEFARGQSDISDLVVWVGGDIIQNFLHDEDAETNFLGPAEAILCAQSHIASGIEFLLKFSEAANIRVVFSWGNHARTTRFMHAGGNDKHSWERVMAGNLAMYFSKEKRVQFVIPRSYFTLVEAGGCLVRFHHGDAIRYAGGIGGVGIPLRKKIAQWNKQARVDFDVIGHFHQHESTWDYVLSGCLCGFDSFAQRIGASYQPPTQTFIVCDRGHRVLTEPIFVENL